MTAAPVSVQASLPQCCEVCEGDERVLLAGPGGARAAVVPCLHCQWRLPIRIYPREER